MVRKLRDENLLRKHFYGYTHGEELNNCPQHYNSVEEGDRETASAIKRAWTSERHGTWATEGSREHFVCEPFSGSGRVRALVPSKSLRVALFTHVASLSKFHLHGCTLSKLFPKCGCGKCNC